MQQTHNISKIVAGIVATESNKEYGNKHPSFLNEERRE